MNDALAGAGSRAPILVETSRALPLVHLTIAERTGSIEDPEGKEGLSRLVARLMRRTGGGLTAQEIDTRIDSLGASLGADVSHSAISIHGSVIARNLEPFLELLLDVMARPGFDEQELGRLKRETEAELVEARDNDRSLARRFFQRRLFEGHPYARPISGKIGTIRGIERADVAELYGRTCVANNLIVGFAGDIDEAGAHRIAGRLFSALPAGHARTDAVPEPSFPTGRQLVIVDKPERTQTQILIGTRGTHPSDPDHIALHVANTVFGGTFTARLMKEIRSKRGWSYGAYSNLPYDRRRQAFSLWTFPKATDAAACIRVELELLEKWRSAGITKRELQWAKRYLVRSHAFAIDTASKRVGLKLDELVYDLPPRYYAEYLERVRAVTLEQVNASIPARIPTRDLLITVVGTESEIGDAVRGAIDGLDQHDVVPFDAD